MTLPTAADIQALLAYLPRLYAPGFEPVLRWHGGVKGADGVIHLPYPEYHPLVEAFYRQAAAPCWLDTGYKPEEAWKLLQDEELVRTADLNRIRAMLTYCVRGERFSDGHWGEMIQAGHIRRILERLGELLVNKSGKE